MNGYLELADGALVGVRDGLVFGRVAACDVVVDDSKASRRHARLIVEGGVVEIEDLDSSNGTLLNGKPVERRMLRDGDQVRIGKTKIVYREGPLPGSRSKSGSSGAVGSSAGGTSPPVFADEDDLLGGDDLFGGDDLSAGNAPAAPPAPPVAAPTPPRPPEPVPAAPQPPASPLSASPPSGPEPPPPAPRPAVSPVAPPAGPAAASNVVEFEDEVVEVRKAPPPEAVVSQRSSSPGGASKASSADDDVVAASQRVLQYSKKAGGGGLLGDDLGQMSGGMRTLVVFAVIAVGGAIIWGVMTAMR